MLYLWLTFKYLLSQIAYFTLTLESKYADDTHLTYADNDMEATQSTGGPNSRCEKRL